MIFRSFPARFGNRDKALSERFKCRRSALLPMPSSAIWKSVYEHISIPQKPFIPSCIVRTTDGLRCLKRPVFVPGSHPSAYACARMRYVRGRCVIGPLARGRPGKSAVSTNVVKNCVACRFQKTQCAEVWWSSYRHHSYLNTSIDWPYLFTGLPLLVACF